MRPECIEAVQSAAGREMSKAELKDIEDRVKNLLPLARKTLLDEGAPVNRNTITARAGELAARQIQRDAEVAQQRVGLAVVAREKVMGTVDRAVREGRTQFEGLGDAIADVDKQAHGIARYYWSQMMDLVNAAEPRFLGMLENPAAVRDLVFEMFDKDTGNAVAKAGAQAWEKITTEIRLRFNAAGGNIRKLMDWALPTVHDPDRLRKAGLESWVAHVMKLVSREDYVTPTGRLMNDVELSEVLAEIWRTIQTGGLNNLEPGSLVSQQMAANKHSDARKLHFASPEAWLEYHASYGRGSVYDALQGHIQMLSRDIALLEGFGPNPDHLFKYARDVALIGGAGGGATDRIWRGALPVTTEQLWANVTGRVNQVGEYAKLAEIAQGVRNIEVGGKLGSAMLASLNDLATLMTTLHYNRLPMFEGMANFVRAFGRESTDYANRAGLIAESLISDMNRWGEGNVGKGWTARLANATMKASFLTAWTDGVRRGFSITMMGGLGKMSRKAWGALDEGDRFRMEQHGIGDREWRLYRLAEPEDWRGSKMLTPEAIKAIPDERLRAAGYRPIDRERAITRLISMIVDESEFASVGQDLYARTQLNQGTQKGTITGELARSVGLFKGFGFAMISRHWMRALHADQAGHSRLAYAASLGLGLTILGALSLDLKDLKAGKDPRDKTDWRYWSQAFAQGGGASIFGDLLYAGLSGSGRGGQSGATTLASSVGGPVLGDAFELIGDLGLENARQAAKGQETHIGAEALRFGLSHAPLINTWYVRAALDHAFLQQAQEFLSPGYLQRMTSRTYSEFGQDYWWQPGRAEPSRAPRFGN